MAQTQYLQPRDRVRIPLIGTAFSRSISAASGTSSSSGIVGVGVVGSMIVGYTVSSSKDQRFVNLLPEHIVNPVTRAETYYLSKRPGFASNTTPAAGKIGSAIHVWAGKGTGTDVISAFDTPNSTLYNGTSSIGTTTGKVLFINDTLVGSTANVTAITDDNKAYFYPEGGALTRITDADFPGNAGETITGDFAFLNGTNYIMTTSGKIYNSDLNSLANWTANSYISAQMSPDKGIGVLRFKDQIMALGRESIEFFQDIGNPTGSPLKSTSQGAISIGVVSQFTIGTMDDTVVWIGTSAQSGIGLYMMDGFSPAKKSTPAIEALLAATNLSGLYLNCVKMVGKSLVVISSTSNNRTYVYCVEDDLWVEWSGESILWQHLTGIAAGTKYVYAVSELTSSGKTYIVNPTAFVFQDDSRNYTALVQTSRWDAQTARRKFISKLRVIGDMQSTSCPVDISWSDDDYTTWHTTRSVNMTASDPYLTGCGSFRRRSFILSNTSSTPLRIEALELELSQGIH